MAMLMFDDEIERKNVAKPLLCEACLITTLKSDEKQCDRCVARIAERAEHDAAWQRLHIRLAVILMLMLAALAFGVRYTYRAMQDHGVRKVSVESGVRHD